MRQVTLSDIDVLKLLRRIMWYHMYHKVHVALLVEILRESSIFVMFIHGAKIDKSEHWTNQAPRFGWWGFKVAACLNSFLWPPLHETTADKRKTDNEIALMWIGKAHGHSRQRTRGQLCILVSFMSLSLKGSSWVHYCIWRERTDSAMLCFHRINCCFG